MSNLKPVAHVWSCRNPGQVALLWTHQPAPFGHGWIDVKSEPLVRLSDVEALRKDAERYRWLQRQHSAEWRIIAEMPLNHTDDYIDAAIAAQGVTP